MMSLRMWQRAIVYCKRVPFEEARGVEGLGFEGSGFSEGEKSRALGFLGFSGSLGAHHEPACCHPRTAQRLQRCVRDCATEKLQDVLVYKTVLQEVVRVFRPSSQESFQLTSSQNVVEHTETRSLSPNSKPPSP